MGDTQWEELEGRPYSVAAKGRRYQEIAEAIQRSMSSLRAIEDEMGNTSLALDKTRKLAGDVRESIEKARVRYQDTGEALETYGNALRPAKYDQADPAAVKLRTLRSDLAEARTRASTAQNAVADLPSDATPAEVSAATRAATDAGGTVSALESEVSGYETQWQEGKDAKDAAANEAITKIAEVVSGKKTNGLKDGFWDRVGDVWSKIGDVVKMVCDIAGILAIFLAWVPVLGQVLLVLAAIGALIAIVEGIVKMCKEGFSWGAAFAVFLGVASLFGGRAISALAKYTKAKSVVNATGTMTNRAARLRFGRALIRDSHAVLQQSRTARAFDLLKSPFVRSADDVARMQAFRNGAGFGSQLGDAARAAFPNPFNDVGRRALFGNSDVIDSFALKGAGTMAGETKYIFEGGTKVAINVARGGAATLQGLKYVDAGQKAWTNFSEGNVLAGIGSVHGGATSALDAPWSSISGNAIKYLDKAF